ncbi:MAG: transketolase, partial [Bacteroidetes bacterium]
LYADLEHTPTVAAMRKELKVHTHPQVHELVANGRRLLYYLRAQQHPRAAAVEQWVTKLDAQYRRIYDRHLYSESADSALRVPVVKPVFAAEPQLKNGYEVLNTFFARVFERYPNLYAFGEDVGRIGGVNQGMAGLQAKFGEDRIFDTGIREWTIMGQAIGMALRGLRPIAEIQYLDYLIYGLQPLTDDLATLRWRSNGQQKAPVIVRTRGHRLEGVWHSGSPIGMLLNSIRGMYLCVPRNMVQAAGMYNTLLQGGEPGIVIECLNGYRLKENMPTNIGDYTVPLGVPEVLREGTDVSLLTYGSCVRIAQTACERLANYGISVELIDVQTLLPFDLEDRIQGSLAKTNRLLIVDEDVPGGASAYILQQVLEKQKGYFQLDAPPRTLTAAAHRPPYGSDGDYFSKPSAEDIMDAVLALVRE